MVDISPPHIKFKIQCCDAHTVVNPKRQFFQQQVSLRRLKFCPSMELLQGTIDRAWRRRKWWTLAVFQDICRVAAYFIAKDREQTGIWALIDKCLAAKGVVCDIWEAEINERVAALYGL